jgi:hypothetical protein
MAKRSKPRRKSAPPASTLGHVLLYDGVAFYFVPADRISPPIHLSSEDEAMVLGRIDELEKSAPENLLVAVRFGEIEMPIKLMGHN